MIDSKRPYGKQRPQNALMNLVLVNLNMKKTVEQIAATLDTTPHVINGAIDRLRNNNKLPKGLVIVQ